MLHEICLTCHKPIKSIQTQLPHKGFITYVWNCGHIETRKKSATPINNTDASQTDLNNIAPSPTLEPNTSTCVAPEPTQKELYNDLDRWINDGGAYKKTPQQLDQEAKENTLAIAKYERLHNPIWSSVDGNKHAYEYQIECVEFAESAQLRCLIGDAMGVGKTIEALLTVKRNKSIVSPTLAVVPAPTVFQWAAQYQTWVSKRFGSIMPITERHNIIPGFDFYIISMDFLARKGVLDLVKALNIKCLIIDEAQKFKDLASKRTQALYNLIEEQNIRYLLPMSGTIIKNRMSEYFPILNMLDPLTFDTPANFKKRWLVQNLAGQYTKLNPYRIDRFKDLTGRYIIRREKHEVLKDLPPITRDYQLVDILDQGIKDTYNHQIGLFQSFLTNTAKIDQKELLGWLAKLRAITGMAKVSYAAEWINDFLESNDETVAIGVHHHSVRETLYNVFNANNLNPLSLSGLDDMYRKRQIIADFNSGKHRVLVINTLAGGTGIDGLQSCANALVLEREWTSADEEQFESRFHRDGQVKGVTITYMIARGTIDEFFHEMVREKRSILATVGIGEDNDPMSSLTSLKEFAEFVASNTL